MEIARHGSAYTASSAGKLRDLDQFAIYVDITTSSDGLSSFEKIFSYFMNQEEMNFLLGQWKDGFLPVLRADQKIHTIKLGVDGALRMGERSRFLLSYDGSKFRLYQDGMVRNSRETGALSFSNWDRTYPLVVGTDAAGRSQWKGTVYEAAIFDRALSPKDMAKWQSGGSIEPQASSHTPQGARQENPPMSPFTKGGGLGGGPFAKGEGTDGRPLIHYVFKPENKYETEFRGKRALGVRDLGKGEPLDLVIPEHFMPYQRVYLGWVPDWMRNRSDWIDVTINILGFIPFGVLFIFTAAKMKCLSVLVPECLSEEKKEGFGNQASGFGIKQENPPICRPDPHCGGGPVRNEPDMVAHPNGMRPLSPFIKGGGKTGNGLPDRNGEGIDKKRLACIVLLTVVAGFVVSLAIELLQAYLPSRDSSLRDLITNVLGTAMGAVIAAQLLRNRCAE